MLTDQLLSEIQSGHGQRLAVAARILPSNRQNKSVTMSCLLRWVMDGVRLPSGERIQLEAARIAGKWVTTPQAIRRFVEAQSPKHSDTTPTPRNRTSRQRQRAAERAGQDLQEMGA
jgi:hypothetical protein